MASGCSSDAKSSGKSRCSREAPVNLDMQPRKRRRERCGRKDLHTYDILHSFFPKSLLRVERGPLLPDQWCRLETLLSLTLLCSSRPASSARETTNLAALETIALQLASPRSHRAGAQRRQGMSFLIAPRVRFSAGSMNSWWKAKGRYAYAHSTHAAQSHFPDAAIPVELSLIHI